MQKWNENTDDFKPLFDVLESKGIPISEIGFESDWCNNIVDQLVCIEFEYQQLPFEIPYTVDSFVESMNIYLGLWTDWIIYASDEQIRLTSSTFLNFV